MLIEDSINPPLLYPRFFSEHRDNFCFEQFSRDYAHDY
tara:strand:+ start:168 stop:281 length:114 start_codon:yes stop_codon:yes gene_type:complete